MIWPWGKVVWYWNLLWKLFLDWRKRYLYLPKWNLYQVRPIRSYFSRARNMLKQVSVIQIFYVFSERMFYFAWRDFCRGYIGPFHANAPFLYTLKTSEDVFRGCRNRNLAWKGLTRKLLLVRVWDIFRPK